MRAWVCIQDLAACALCLPMALNLPRLSTRSSRTHFQSCSFNSVFPASLQPSDLISGPSIFISPLSGLAQLKRKEDWFSQVLPPRLCGDHSHLLKVTAARPEAWFQDSWECLQMLKTRVFWLQRNLWCYGISESRRRFWRCLDILDVHSCIWSANHVAVIQSIQATCRCCQDGAPRFKASIRILEEKGFYWTWFSAPDWRLWSPGIFTTSEPSSGEPSQWDKLSSVQQLRGLERLVDVRGQRRLVTPAGDHRKSTGTQKTWVQAMSLNIPHERKGWTQLEDLFSWTLGVMFCRLADLTWGQFPFQPKQLGVNGQN